MHLADFMGLWRLDRRIVQADGVEAAFAGQAEWLPADHGALYVETGTLVMPAGRFRAERRYLWEPDLTVRFDDGRFFHRVPTAGGGTGHWCDPDRYDVTYDFDGWPAWSCRWVVRGPRKDYAMTSHYARA
ncbi:DUF6314 family protein [Ponticoccus alexandrii]